jgi:hypothetical protein
VTGAQTKIISKRNKKYLLTEIYGIYYYIYRFGLFLLDKNYIEREVLELGNLENILLSIDESLKRIAGSLEKIAGAKNKEFDIIDETDIHVLKEKLSNVTHELSPNLEAQLFNRLTDVYLHEEIERVRSNRNKKAPRRVSIKLGLTLEEFFSSHLNIAGLRIERSKIGGLLVFYKEDIAFATLKYMTDLGYCRGERFYEAIEDIVSLSEDEFGVESDNVFILVSSLFNGIEKTHVQQLLNQSIDSNYDFLTNRNLVDTFLDKYISAIEILPQPKEQIYFLASELHPNVIANDLLNEKIDNDTIMDHINNYRWLSSISKLIESIKERS